MNRFLPPKGTPDAEMIVPNGSIPDVVGEGLVRITEHIREIAEEPLRAVLFSVVLLDGSVKTTAVATQEDMMIILTDLMQRSGINIKAQKPS